MTTKVDLPIKDPGFLENISQVDVGIQEIWVERDGFFKMVDGEPNFTSGVKHTSQITPSDGEFRVRLDGFQVACLHTIIQSD